MIFLVTWLLSEYWVTKYQVCGKSVLNFVEVYIADYKGEFANADVDANFHKG